MLEKHIDRKPLSNSDRKASLENIETSRDMVRTNKEESPTNSYLNEQELPVKSLKIAVVQGNRVDL